MSSLHRAHANLLCIVPLLVYVLPKGAWDFLLCGNAEETTPWGTKGHLSERAEGSLLQFRLVLLDCEEGLKNHCFAPELVLWEGSSGSVAEDLNFYLGGAEAIIGREAAVTLARREFCSSVWFIHSCFHLCSEVIKVLSICLIPSFFSWDFIWLCWAFMAAGFL